MENTQAALLVRIEAFLVKERIGAARFGEMALQDRNFVFDLRKGKREFRSSTLSKSARFMDEYERERREKSAA